VTEEEETPTSACTLPCFEHHVSVSIWAKTFEDDVCRYAVTLLDALEVEWCVDIHLDNGLDPDFVDDDSTVGKFLLAFVQSYRSGASCHVILVEVFRFDDVPNGRIFDLDRLELDLALVNSTFDLAVLLTRATIFNGLALLRELLNALQDDIHQLNVEA